MERKKYYILTIPIFLLLFLSTQVLNNDIYSSTLLGKTKLNVTGEAQNSKYLSITNHSAYKDPLFTLVEGTISNNSSNTMNSVKVNTEYYDANNTLITADSGTIDLVILNPGQNSSFSVNTELGDEEISGYKVTPAGDIGR